MTKKESTTMSENEEMLLMRYVDNECTPEEKAAVDALLETRHECRCFVDSLKCGCDSTKDALMSFYGASKIDLWDRIERRLEEEERSEILLGKRTINSPCNPLRHAPHQRESFVERWSSVLREHLLGFGLSGAAVAAGIAAFSLSTFSANPQMAKVAPSAPRAQQAPMGIALSSTPIVNLVSEGGMSRMPRIIEERVPSSVEVDWMRSRGRVRMLPDPSGNSNIIWIRKRNPSTENGQPIAILNEREPVASTLNDEK